MRSLYGVWPLTASMGVKNKYAYVITQDICNKFIEVIFCGMYGFSAKSSVTTLNILGLLHDKIHIKDQNERKIVPLLEIGKI